MKRSKEGRKSQEEGSRVSEKELIRRLGEELDVRLKKARREGNLVIKDALEDEKTIRDVFDEGEGVFRLFPAFVPRRFGKAGRRLRLHPDDYFAFGMARESITERWFSSTMAAQNGELAKADEGMSYVCVSYRSEEKFSLKRAVDILGEKLVGKRLMEEYGGWPMYSKFFDNENPLFHHLHLGFADAKRVGKLGKPECYFFPKQYNNHFGEANYTYFEAATPRSVRSRTRCPEPIHPRVFPVRPVRPAVSGRCRGSVLLLHVSAPGPFRSRSAPGPAPVPWR